MSFQNTLDYLYTFIPQGNGATFPGERGLARTKFLLHLLGDPQEKIKVIHIAGTSGKGSTAFYISSLLVAHKKLVGLGVSPHLLDVRERFQINNRLISEKDFSNYIKEVLPAIQKTCRSEYGKPTFFEITSALAYYIFCRRNVDYAVVETGLGGLYDATNVVQNRTKIAVITRIGHDHTQILGKTLCKIALQKAGIIKPYNQVITIPQNYEALRVIKREAVRHNAILTILPRKTITPTTIVPLPQFNYRFEKTQIDNIKLKAMGSFQVPNSAQALATLSYVTTRDKFQLQPDVVKHVFASVSFGGRMQLFESDKNTIIIDGAHNPQKMSAFITSLITYFPSQKFCFLVAFKRGKDIAKMLRILIPFANSILITTFFNQIKSQGFATFAEEPLKVAKILSRMNFTRFAIEPNGNRAIHRLMSDPQFVGVITGSLYLVSDVYPIILQLTNSSKQSYK